MFRYIQRVEDGSLATVDAEGVPDVSGLSERVRYTAWNGSDHVVGYGEAEGTPTLYLVYRGDEPQTATDGALSWFQNEAGEDVARLPSES